MAKLNIITDSNEILRKRSKEVTEFSERLHQLLDDMADTMHAHNGVGIAAVQVGVLMRACLVNTPQGLFELINPVIVSAKRFKSGDEGCLSVPSGRGNVTRPHEVKVSYFDRNGDPNTQIFKGQSAVCAAHETDHLDGILFTDKLDSKRGNK